jgi:hypothetical protein
LAHAGDNATSAAIPAIGPSLAFEKSECGSNFMTSPFSATRGSRASPDGISAAMWH